MDTSIVLNWTKPEDDGGAEIFNYVIEYRPEGQMKWKRATEDTIAELTKKLTRLQTGAEFEFHVAAENKAGLGPWSDPSHPVVIKEPIGKFLLLPFQFFYLQHIMLSQFNSIFLS